MFSSEYVDEEHLWQCAYCDALTSNKQNVVRHKEANHPEKFKPVEHRTHIPVNYENTVPQDRTTSRGIVKHME